MLVVENHGPCSDDQGVKCGLIRIVHMYCTVSGFYSKVLYMRSEQRMFGRTRFFKQFVSISSAEVVEYSYTVK